MAASFKTIPIQYHCVANSIIIHSYRVFGSFQDHFFLFSIFTAQWQDSLFSNRPHSTGPPRTSRRPSRSGRVTSPSHWKCPISPERDGMPASLVFWAPKVSRDGNISISPKMSKNRKTPEDIFTAFTNTLEVSTSQWNYIDEMYSNICQGEQETTDQLDQRIKILVEKCSYPTNEEKERCWLELLFHATKHFKVKKWVRSQTALNETVTSDKLLQHAKQHEATVKDFHQHKSNRGVATSTTINEIRTFTRKGQGSRARARTRSKGKICDKCGTSHPPRECPVWGKKCHKCGNKNHFSTQCRSRQSGGGDRRSHNTSKGCKGKGKHQQSRSRSNQVTKSAHSIESASFQDHSGNLHRDSADLHGQQRGQTGDLHGASHSTEFLKQSFSTISRSKSVASISNDTDPEGKTKILTVLQLKLPHHNGTDDITVKVDDGAEGNILPLNSFRAMFPHALDANGYLKPGFLRGSKDNVRMLWWWEAGESWQHQALTPALLRKFLSRPFFLCCRNQDDKTNHCWSSSQHQVRSY